MVKDINLDIPQLEKEEKLISDYIDIKMRVEQRVNKNGDPYKMLTLYMPIEKTGELINFHEIYIKENLSQIINYFMKENKNKKSKDD